jgi:hypothetical protein
MNTIAVLKTFLGGGLSRAGARREILLRWVPALLFCATALTPVHAKPVVSNNDGFFFDEYVDNLGIFTASQVQVAAGTASL